MNRKRQRTRCGLAGGTHLVSPGWQIDAALAKIDSTGEEHQTTYFYVVATVGLSSGCFVQCGSAPNFHGGYLTLCTCKHRMRTWRSADDWKGCWIAGFSGRNVYGSRNYLVYLMRVGAAFASQRDLWRSGHLPERAKRVKAATRNVLGDLFEPRSGGGGGPFDPSSYRRPVAGHSHALGGAWQRDIDYETRAGKRPALLVGDPRRTFVWQRPLIYLNDLLTQGQRRMPLGRFVRKLRSDV